MRVRIEDPGEGPLGRVTTEGGEELSVLRAVWIHDWQNGIPPHVVLDLLLSSIDAVAEVSGLFCVVDGKRYRMVEEREA